MQITRTKKVMMKSHESHEFHNNLPFLLERMKIEKFEKLVFNLHC